MVGKKIVKTKMSFGSRKSSKEEEVQ